MPLLQAFFPDGDVLPNVSPTNVTSLFYSTAAWLIFSFSLCLLFCSPTLCDPSLSFSLFMQMYTVWKIWRSRIYAISLSMLLEELFFKEDCSKLQNIRWKKCKICCNIMCPSFSGHNCTVIYKPFALIITISHAETLVRCTKHTFILCLLCPCRRPFPNRGLTVQPHTYTHLTLQ